MNYLSCAPTTLYRGGGFYEGPILLEQLSGLGQAVQDESRSIKEIFPHYTCERPPPLVQFTTDPDFKGQLAQQMTHLNDGMRNGPACTLVRLGAGFLHGSVLYTRSPAGVRIVYETHRPNDRPYVPEIDPLTTGLGRAPMSDSLGVDLFIGSAGTGNYGHWLVDDLPRAASVAILRRMAGARPIRIWIADAGHTMNAVREASLRRLCQGSEPIDVRFALADKVYDFIDLYYATPVSYHPVLKSPTALEWLADDFAGQPRTRRIFVSRRPERSRGLLNLDAIWPYLAGLGFEAIEAEGMTFEEQANTFAQAEMVVGCMGAAMTNTLFCEQGTPILYLAPEGWIEPFYWDLAAVCGHRYGVVYGAVDTTDVPAHLASFTIQPDRVEAGLAAMLAG